MATERFDLEKNRASWIVAALVGLFAIAAVVVTRPDGSSPSLSAVSGLMSLKATAQAAMPYDIAMADPKPTLVEFYADWCTTCQALAPTLQDIHEQAGDQINFVMLDIDDPQWRQQVNQFQVSGVPHLALLDSSHVVADSFVGRVPRQVLVARIADLL
ncbi:MAG: thioredoxin domain-containing protein [Elainellaceae cyanobacterium]